MRKFLIYLFTLTSSLSASDIPKVIQNLEFQENQILNGVRYKKQEKMLDDFHSLAHCFDIHYALKELKKEQFQWDFEKESASVREKISNNILSFKEFQKLIVDFCHSTRDYHVDLSFLSTERASLPFVIKGSEERYFIAWCEEGSGLNQQDEILEFDGKPIHRAVVELESTRYIQNNQETDRRLAEYDLTSRSAFSVPQGKITIKAQTKNKAPRMLTFDWNYTPEKITNAFSLAPLKKKHTFKREWKTPLFRKNRNAGLDLIGEECSYVPPLGKMIWKNTTETSFNGCIYQVGEKLVGYLRIADYSFEGAQWAEDFRQLIGHLELHSDLLVLDQVSNPGGDPLCLFSILSMLTDYRLQMPLEKVLLTKSFAADCYHIVECYEEFSKNEISGLTDHLGDHTEKRKAVENLYHYHHFLLNQWQMGYTLSDPVALIGFNEILPHKTTRYTKPIVVLVDELDFSCADLLPAILQDNERALIFGKKTAGAGGCQLSYEVPSHFGFGTLYLTHSIIYRMDGTCIENKGVTPDIFYELTVEDLQCNYKGYKKALLDCIDYFFTPDFCHLVRSEA